MIKEKHYKLILAALLLIVGTPYIVTAQTLSLDDLAVYVGADHSLVRWDSDSDSPYVGDRTDLNMNPHIKLSYRLPISTQINTHLLADYGRIGFFEDFTTSGNDVINTKQRLNLQTISVGIQGLMEVFHFNVGPVFNWRSILNGEYKISRKRDGQWTPVVSDDEYGDKFLAQSLYEVGFTVQRSIGEYLNLSVEGLYGLNDIFIHEDKLPAQPVGDIKWHLHHYRISVGYSF